MVLELLLRWLSKGEGAKVDDVKHTALGYADDIKISANTIKEMNNRFAKVEAFGEWANIQLKPAKCASMSLRKGEHSKRVFTTCNNICITALQKSESYAFLGTLIDPKLKYTDIRKNIEKKVIKYINILHQADLYGWMKVTLLKGFVMPRITFPFSTANIPITFLERLGRKIRRAMRLWLGLPPNACNASFYSTTEKLGLAVRSLVDEYKHAQFTTAIKTITSNDAKVKSISVSSYKAELNLLCKKMAESDISIACLNNYEEFETITPGQWVDLANTVELHHPTFKWSINTMNTTILFMCIVPYYTLGTAHSQLPVPVVAKMKVKMKVKGENKENNYKKKMKVNI